MPATLPSMGPGASIYFDFSGMYVVPTLAAILLQPAYLIKPQMLYRFGYVDSNSDSTCDSRSRSSISLGESETEQGSEKPMNQGF